MLKKQIITLFALFTLVLACSKKDSPDAPPPVNATIKAVQGYLSSTAGLATFAGSFQATTIAEADLGNGITVFAPTDNAITSYDPNARIESTSLTTDEVKDHVVKGVIKKADLTNGKKLLTLSGKELAITIDGDKIYVHGALILTSKEETSNVVFTIDNVLCKKAGNVEITVYDATQWSTTDTSGKVVANADVALYYSRSDFINNQTPAFTGKTSVSGKILFGGLAPGTYYLVTKKDDKFNYIEPQMINGKLLAYRPVGIFQDQNQINNNPWLSGEVVGDFKFMDVNFDGVITTDDKTWVPFDVIVASNKTVQVKSLIGYVKNRVAAPFTSIAEAQAYLDNIYTSIGNWQQFKTVVDGVLSDDADCSTLSSFCELDNFTITPTNINTTSIWQNGYSYISMLNRLINYVPALNPSTTDLNNLVGQAKGLRGYVCLELATYFGGLPLQTGPTNNNLSRSTLADTYTFIKDDLAAGIAYLPTRYVNADHRRINADACRLLMARVAMAQGDYARAKQFSDNLIEGGLYQLMPTGSIFVGDDNMEIVWNVNPSIVAYASFFNDGKSKTFNPIGRYTEVLLINTEARFAMNDLNANLLNTVLARSNQPIVGYADQALAIAGVQQAWKNELSREGQRFAKLVQWGKAAAVLGAKGFIPSKNSLLPIPQYLMDTNPKIVQNPGY